MRLFHVDQNRRFLPGNITGALLIGAALGVSLALSGCGGGGGGGDEGGRDDEGLESANFDCDGACARQNLSVAEVAGILSSGVTAAQHAGVAGTFSVVDRVGNVLAVYRMNGAPELTTISGQRDAVGGLEGVAVPATLAAISKAGTGAYLSSQGNAFSTRTASQIIQENFNPGERNQPGGPLSGVQFSQLFCSDVTVRNPSVSSGLPAGSKFTAPGSVGPRPLPLGLSADPGGFPLYKGGDLVGGVGVEADGSYRLDATITNRDQDIDEAIALAATRGFEAPSQRTAGNITVGGKNFRYTDVSYRDLNPLTELVNLEGAGNFVAIPEFTDGAPRAGSTFGAPSSGVADTVRAGIAAAVLVNARGEPRYPTRGGVPLSNGAELRAAEVDAILDSALLTAFRARAAIRRPLDTSARVSIWVVDALGTPLGFVRSQDAPVFGIDVALQKARTAAFFSAPDMLSRLREVQARNQVGAFNDWAGQLERFLGGQVAGRAFTNRAIGNMARPFFVDGINGRPPGPLSHPFPGTAQGRSWSPFNTGLQLDLIFQRLVAPLGVPAPPRALPDSCTDTQIFGRRIANGIQIFPGSVPLYRGGILVGAIGVSGDGIDQDDMIGFYGVSVRGLAQAGHEGLGDTMFGFNAPATIRSDQIPLADGDTRLRYVNCPEAPFAGSDEQNVCGDG